MSTKLASLLLLLLWQASPRDEPPVAQPGHMRYQRMLSVPPGGGQVCTVLDAQIFPHAEPSLKDLRIFPVKTGPSNSGPSQGAPHEVPYAITLSETTTQDIRAAKVLNLGTRRRSGGTEPLIVFDLEMPERPYTDVMLGLGGADFLATATVSGMETLGGKATALGVFTLFDLTSQHLSRDTTLPLPESTFRYLHVALSVSPAPGTTSQPEHFDPAMVEGAQVPPSRETQTIYTTVATVAMPTTATPPSPRKTRFDFVVPLRVPVERVSFDLPSAYSGNFSRDVVVRATPDSVPGNVEGMALPTEAIMGTISRVHSIQAGRKIDEEDLSLPATIGSNLQSAAHVSVEVDNGDDLPLPIAAVRLEMRQRKLCFGATANIDPGVSLYYGDPALLAPVYDYQRLFTPSEKPLVAQLGPEQMNPNYVPPPAEIRPFTERHPEVLWIALIAVICVLGVVALKSSRNVGR